MHSSCMAFRSSPSCCPPERMQANSRVPTSTQNGIHEQLARLLERHWQAPYLKPYADYNRAAFAASMARREALAPAVPLILDSGCGVGASSIALARAYPDCYVIGVDQSQARLQRAQSRLRRQDTRADALPANLDLVRADLVDYWRLLRDAGIHPVRHYLLYPNPWPKIGQLARRWHGHPVFPALLELGGVLECRSNWKIYIDEFCFAVERLTRCRAICEPYLPRDALTPFERKYLNSGHALYRASVTL